MTGGELLYLSKPQFLHLYNGDDISPDCTLGVLVQINETVQQSSWLGRCYVAGTGRPLALRLHLWLLLGPELHRLQDLGSHIHHPD